MLALVFLAALVCLAAPAAAVAGELARLKADGKLPKGFSVGAASLGFNPAEKPSMDAKMKLSLLALEEPTDSFAAVFTKNQFPGAPVIVGKKRLAASHIQAVVINNKISNVCAGSAAGGVADSERVCTELAKTLGIASKDLVIPCSTGIIGWRLPVDEMVASLPALVQSRQSESGFDAAVGIMTTDSYPKLRAAETCGGRVVAFAKGAGMIEPNMATMLGFVLTDVAVPRDDLRAILSRVAATTFNCISVDGDQSTSDTVLALSSKKVPLPSGEGALADFESALARVCGALAEDIVRNGEGVKHVMQVRVSGAPDEDVARRVGKSVVNSNLFKCAVAGNDPNVGRIIAAVGSCVGNSIPGLSLDACTVAMGGRTLFKEGRFELDGDTEDVLFEYLRDAELPPQPHGPNDEWPFPEHERNVEIDIDLGVGSAESTVFGADLTHEYVDINADYRS